MKKIANYIQASHSLIFNYNERRGKYKKKKRISKVGVQGHIKNPPKQRKND